MAKKKASGSTRQHTTRPGKRLGLKKSGGQSVKTGMIIVRQRGSKILPGDGVGMGRDHTLFALRDGILTFKTKMNKKIAIVLNKK